MHNALVSTALIQFDCFPQRFTKVKKREPAPLT